MQSLEKSCCCMFSSASFEPHSYVTRYQIGKCLEFFYGHRWALGWNSYVMHPVRQCWELNVYSLQMHNSPPQIRQKRRCMERRCRGDNTGEAVLEPCSNIEKPNLRIIVSKIREQVSFPLPPSSYAHSTAIQKT